MLKLGVHFVSAKAESLYRAAGFQDNLSSGFDVVNTEPISLMPRQLQIVPLGIVVRPPENFHCLVLPRSSTFKRWRIILANSLGLIDQNYCGIHDEWRFPALYLPDIGEDGEDLFVPEGTRIGQFIIQPVYRFETYPYAPPQESRGGLGSTGA